VLHRHHDRAAALNLTPNSTGAPYIRTAIHDAGRELGVGLDGAVPAEKRSDPARTLVRAALGAPALRGLAARGGAARAPGALSTAREGAAAGAARRPGRS
jgi:hypothetical protein